MLGFKFMKIDSGILNFLTCLTLLTQASGYIHLPGWSDSHRD